MQISLQVCFAETQIDVFICSTEKTPKSPLTAMWLWCGSEAEERELGPLPGNWKAGKVVHSDEGV